MAFSLASTGIPPVGLDYSTYRRELANQQMQTANPLPSVATHHRHQHPPPRGNHQFQVQHHGIHGGPIRYSPGFDQQQLQVQRSQQHAAHQALNSSQFSIQSQQEPQYNTVTGIYMFNQPSPGRFQQANHNANALPVSGNGIYHFQNVQSVQPALRLPTRGATNTFSTARPAVARPSGLKDEEQRFLKLLEYYWMKKPVDLIQPVPPPASQSTSTT